MQGGSGADVFLYANGDGSDGKDRIVDYAEEDTIKITAGKIKSKTTSGSASNVLEDDNFITGNDLSALVKEKATDYSLVQTNLIQKNTRLPSVTYSSKK